MKYCKNTISAGVAMLTAALALSACSSIDDDLSDCGADVSLTYRMRLVTNMETEIDSVLAEAADQPVADALRQTMRQYFSDRGNDLDLAFFDSMGGQQLMQTTQDMNGQRQATYTLYLDQADYRHTAVANRQGNGVAQWSSPETISQAALRNTAADTIGSHQRGIFTGRHSFSVASTDKLSGTVDLYMANDAAALVVDTTGVTVAGARAFLCGLASAFLPGDSTYTFNKPQAVETTPLPVTAGREMCFYGMGFPSPDTPTRADGDPYYWQFKLYVTMPDGTVTENIISIQQPLRAAQLRIIKLRLKDNGEASSVSAEVGVSVTLNWKPGINFEV